MKVSVGTRLAVVTVTVLVVVTTLVVVVAMRHDRARTLESKRAAATMVTELFAASVSPGVVFGDEDAIRAVLDNLRQTEDVIGGAVFPATPGTPAAGFGVELGARAPAPVELTSGRLVVTRPIYDVEAHPVGTARVAFTLEPEERRLAKSRVEAVGYGLLAMLLVGGVILGVTRQRVVHPLLQLAGSAKRIEDGDLAAQAPVRGDVEIATLARAFNSMGDAIAQRERALKAELEVAADLQVSVLPKSLVVGGAELAAVMRPATEVGGDYYDVLPVADGCWLGIGDVSGHGLGAGVVMLMLQAAVSALVAARPDASPVDLECVVNRVLYENVRERMGRRDYATLSLLRYHADGRVRFAGAHEDLLVYRAASGVVEAVATPGTWVGARKDIARVTEESAIRLEPGDVLVLYTDGVTEARRDGVQFGLDRLRDVLRAAGARPVEAIRDAIASAVTGWTATQTDDITVLVLRHLRRPEASPSP